MSTAIGIDLGTTYSCCAIHKDGKVEIIPNEIGKNTTPSQVCFDEDGVELVGDAAKYQLNVTPGNGIFDVKRIIGRRFSDPELQKDIKKWPFKVIERKNNTPVIHLPSGKTFQPEQISAKLISHLKEQAENHLGLKVTQAVITVPAYFNNDQRQATKDAGKIAGFEVLRLINDPTAVAIAYNFQRQTTDLRTVLVFDLGGSTFDTSILRMEGNNIDMLAVGGDTHLGGEDFDNALVEHCLKEFKEKEGIDLKSGINSSVEKERMKVIKCLRRLKNECEEGKIRLSTARRLVLRLDAFYGEKSLLIKMQREVFNLICKDAFDKCMGTLDEVIKEAKLTKEQIDDVILAGGSSNIPEIQHRITAYFGKKPLKIMKVDEIVAFGAAIQASIIKPETIPRKSGPQVKISDVYARLQCSSVTDMDRLRNLETLTPAIKAEAARLGPINTGNNDAPKNAERVEFNTQDPVGYFNGREKFIEFLHGEIGPQASSSSNHVLSKLVVITGLSGIGKTQTVRKYIQKYRECYGQVIWVNADSLPPATNSFLQLAAKINIDTKKNGKPKEVSELIQEIYDRLTKTIALVIYDDAKQYESNDTETGLKYLLPKRLKLGRQAPAIIITSRSSTTWHLLKTKELPCFTYEESYNLLEAQLDLKYIEVNEEQVNEVMKICEGLPIIIQQVVTAMKDENETREALCEDPYTLRNYFEDLEKIKSNMSLFINGLTISEYSIFKLAFESLLPQIGGELALKCLQVISLLNPDHIPKRLLKHLMTTFDDADSGVKTKKFNYCTDEFLLELYEALKLLLKNNVIINCGKYYETHRMIQTAKLEYDKRNDPIDSQDVIRKLINSFHEYVKSMVINEQYVNEILDNAKRLIQNAESKNGIDCTFFKQLLDEKRKEVGHKKVSAELLLALDRMPQISDSAKMASLSKGPTHSIVSTYDRSKLEINAIKNKNVSRQEMSSSKRKIIRQIPFSVGNFVGRGDEMKKILDYFNACNDGDAHPLDRMFIITGSAGMGKSELAWRFAETHEESFPCVVFLNSETKDSLDASFTELAKELGLIEEDKDEPHKKKLHIDMKLLLPKIYKALSVDYERMLFIFDNAVALESSEDKFGISDFLPQSDYGQLPFFLVTSRNPDFWEHQVKPLKTFPVSLLPEEDTCKFLLDEEIPDLQELIKNITSILGGYPLGLKLMSEIKSTGTAGRFSRIERFKEDLKGYLKILENGVNKFHSDKLQADERQFAFLRAIFEGKVEMISKENEDAVRLLGIISCMNVDDINLQRCYGIFYRIPNDYQWNQELYKTEEIDGALRKLEEHNIVDVEGIPFDLESKIKIHRQLQKLIKMRLASLRDTSLLTDIVLWHEAKNYLSPSSCTQMLRDMLEIFEPSQVPSILPLYFRFLNIFSKDKCVMDEDQLNKYFVTIEQKLRPQTDLRSVVEMNKILILDHQKGEMTEESFQKLEDVLENIQLYDEIWKVHFCIDCSKFLPKEQQQSFLTRLIRQMAEEVQVIDNDLITESILRAVGNCWEFLKVSKVTQEENAAYISRILMQLKPQNRFYEVKEFWMWVLKFLDEPKFLEAFLEEDWLPWICNILAHLKEDNGAELACKHWQTYFIPILEILRSHLVPNSKQVEMLVKNNQFLEIWAYHTQVILSHEKGFCDKSGNSVGLPAMALLIWSELEAKVQPYNSVSHVVESTLNHWLDNSKRIFWLHDLKGEDTYGCNWGELRRKIKLSLEDPNLNFSPAMERSLKWILLTSAPLGYTEYTTSKCNRINDRDFFHWNLFKTEISHQIESLKQKKFGDVALEILKIMSFLDPQTIYYRLARTFKTYTGGTEALKVLQSHCIIHIVGKYDWITLDPVVFEVLWDQMETDERLALLGKVSDFFVDNNPWKLYLNEFVLKKATFEILNDRDQIPWLRLLLSHFGKNYGKMEPELKDLLVMKKPTNNDPAHIYSLMCLFLTEAVDNDGKRIVAEAEILTSLDTLLADTSISLANWNIYIVLAALPKLGKDNKKRFFIN